MNTGKHYLMLFIALPFLLSSGCATMTRGTTEAYQIVSAPSGANVTLSSGETCTTPCTLEKKRGDSFGVRIEMAGYEPHEVMVNSESCELGQAALVGNLLLLGSVVWASIDTLNGSTMQLSPNPCQVKLVPNVINSDG